MIRLTQKIVLAVGLVAVVACGGTKLSGTWQDPNMIGVPLEKVVVLTLAQDKIMRRVAEDEFVKSLPKNTQGIQSYNLIPDDELKDVAKVKARLEKANVDGAAVLRLVGSDNQVTYNPGTIMYSFWGYYGWAYPMVYDTSYVTSEQVVRVETAVYSMTTEKLIWSGVSESINPSSAKSVVDDVVRVVVRDLKRHGIVR